MSDYLPDRFANEPELWNASYKRHVVARRRAENSVVRHNLDAIARAERDKTDSFVLADVVTTALEEEVRFFDYGMALAGGSGAKQELLSRKLEILSQANNRRIGRRFGG